VFSFAKKKEKTRYILTKCFQLSILLFCTTVEKKKTKKKSTDRLDRYKKKKKKKKGKIVLEAQVNQNSSSHININPAAFKYSIRTAAKQRIFLQLFNE
jgi:hypothetical protein